MVKSRSAKSLVRAVLNGVTDCDEAIQRQLDDNYRGRLETPSLKIVHVALCCFNCGQLNQSLDVLDGPTTVAGIIKEFGLELFAPLLNDPDTDRHGEIRYPLGTLVDFWGDTCRVIGRRRVTIQAMPREDEFEIFIEDEDGAPLYFVGESMVEPMEECEEG